MSQSLSALYVHIIFSTKNRAPLIDALICQRLWQYLGGICSALDCPSVQIGGTHDHVHILCSLSRALSPKELVGKLKADSSKWIKSTFSGCEDFYWQSGYGIFSVNPLEQKKLITYIANQEEHHKQRDFCEEFRLFLEKYNIPYDENFIWSER